MIIKISSWISCLAIIMVFSCSPKNSEDELRIHINPSFSEGCVFHFKQGKWSGYIMENYVDTLLQFHIENSLNLDREIRFLNENIEHLDILDGMTVAVSTRNQGSDSSFHIRNRKTILESGILDELISSVEPNSIPELLLSEIKYFYLLDEEIPIFRENEFKKLLDFREQNRNKLKAPENGETPSTIHDTLVFDEGMLGELLKKKFQSAQSELKFYKCHIDAEKIDALIVLEAKHSKTEITYLGLLNDLDHNNAYHIITNFTINGIGERPSPRGHSEVAFISKDLGQIIIYEMGMPDNLPIKIDNNQLIFQLEKTDVQISISGGLPPMLCLPVINCY